MATDERLVEFLRTNYGVQGGMFAWKSERTAFLTGAGDNGFVIRLGSGARRMAASLRYLESRDYRAARVRPSTEGADLVSFDGADLVVLEYVMGDQPSRSPATAGALGEALGALHALGPIHELRVNGPSMETDPITGAEMLPSTELLPGLAEIEASGDGLTPEALSYRDDIIEAIRCLADDFRPLPKALLHGDCHPRNAVISPDGRAVFIDWDSAGPGPAIVDLGFLLLSLGTGLLTGRALAVDPTIVQQVLRGYQRRRGLSNAERDRLVDAIRFRALVFVAGTFLDDIRGGQAPQRGEWWARCVAAEEIASLALLD